MKTVNINQSQTDEYAGQKIIGVELALFAQSMHNNAPIINTDFQLRNCSVSGILKRQGLQPFEVFSTTLDVILKYCNYENSPVTALMATTGDLTLNSNNFVQEFMQVTDLVQFGGGVQTQRLLKAYFHFPCAINLSGEDKFEVSVNFGSGSVVSGGNVDANSCYIQFAQIAGLEHHIEDGLPQFKVFSIQMNQATMNVPCGSGVDEVMFISTDRWDAQTANQVIQKATVAADGMRYTKLATELLTMRSNQTPAFMDDFHLQDVSLLTAKGASNVNLDLTFNVANVTAGNNYIVVARCLGGGGGELIHHANQMLAAGMITKDAHSKVHSHVRAKRNVKM